MATYDSLLLASGGGIISHQQQSPQYNAATLAIGIGGTGVNALAVLKRKVYQQLIPDNPGEPVPEYEKIRFMAIDSDETIRSTLGVGGGIGRLASSEYFSIHNPNIGAVIGTEKGRNTVRSDPKFDWMDIEGITALMSPDGAGGVRQVGRYLLISKADELKNKIFQECQQALMHSNGNDLTIYIFAGISGGTGSGCFIDTCYIVRQILYENGWSGTAKIMGFFFMPDVVLSIPDVMANPATAKYNKSNGYAAMKELDYLMNLHNAEDRFYQKYGGFTIDTQEPPVDMCHLLSATQADGKIRGNGFSYTLNVAADYVIAYLSDVQLPGGGQVTTGLTIRGLIANVTAGINNLVREHGANLNYHVVGASNAEIPMSQISTYLAAGFYRRFLETVDGQDSGNKVSRDAIQKLARDLRLEPEKVNAEMGKGSRLLMLPDVDKGVLKRTGIMEKGKLPEAWVVPYNAFLDENRGKRQQNKIAMCKYPDSFSSENMTGSDADSVTVRIFKKLCDLAEDPAYGPFYAARILHNGGDDLTAYIRGAAKTLDEKAKTQRLQLEGRTGNDGLYGAIVQASTDFCNSSFLNESKRYNIYKETAGRMGIAENRYAQYKDSSEVMNKVADNLDRLYDDFFKPMVRMLSNLKDTFEADTGYLNGAGKHEDEGSFTWQILKLDEIKGKLDESVAALRPGDLVFNFVRYLIKNHAEWREENEPDICACISRYMQDIFQSQMNRTLEDFLAEKYNIPRTNQTALAEKVENDIIQKVFKSSTAMFWCNPVFSLDPAHTFHSGTISVPVSASSVTAAAGNFARSHQEMTCRQVGLKDRIFSLRFYSGIPFYAYQGVTTLKAQYDSAAGTAAGAGAHLYEKTGRGTDGTGDVSWRTFLPTPSPYSVDPELTVNAQAGIALYREGVKTGIIGPDKRGNSGTQGSSAEYKIRISKSLPQLQYTLDDFIKTDVQGRKVFDQNLFAQKKAGLEELKSAMYDDSNCERTIALKNDGSSIAGEEVKERVRIDYFLQYPKVQDAVRRELKKYSEVEKAIENLDQIEKQYTEYADDIDAFSYLLFYGILKSIDFDEKQNYTKIKKVYYIYKTGAGETKEEVFSDVTMPYGSSYPLYQAFVHYRSLPKDRLPRNEMDRRQEQQKKLAFKPLDSLIGRELELYWEGQKMADLHEDIKTLKDGNEISQFYEGLFAKVKEYKDKFSYDAWIYEPPVVTYYIYDPACGRMYQVQSDNLRIGRDTQTGALYSLALTSEMLLYYGENDWRNLQFGADGKPVFPW